MHGRFHEVRGKPVGVVAGLGEAFTPFFKRRIRSLCSSMTMVDSLPLPRIGSHKFYEIRVYTKYMRLNFLYDTCTYTNLKV
jgi:hypothetical protein